MQSIALFTQASRPSLRSWPRPSPKHTCMRPIYHTCHLISSSQPCLQVVLILYALAEAPSSGIRIAVPVTWIFDGYAMRTNE